jgi:radical SAM superfamily enzyme YgiQ (UPF0313 family)
LKAVLISTYELGRQPFGLASPAAWLRRAGADVTMLDLAIQLLAEDVIAEASLVAFYLPMHTATRIAAPLIPRVKRINPCAHVCCYGLYAPVNETYLRELGADTILGGEFEEGLCALYQRLQNPKGSENLSGLPLISLARQPFILPDRKGLPQLNQYAKLVWDGAPTRVTGYTEASRGCKHLCRHCPIVPVYGGQLRIVQPAVVLDDIRQQVAWGAQHITFGDPDFFNGPRHALALVTQLHRTFPDVTYDVTIKVEHLLRHAQHLSQLRDTGCAFVTTAVETIDDAVLQIFDKHHTRADFVRVVSLFRDIGLTLNPTFVTFHPWLSLDDYRELLALLLELDLVDHVAPIQLAIRLLIPAGSRLLELPEVQALVGEFDAAALSYPWTHRDARVTQLYEDVLRIVKEGEAGALSRREIFARVWQRAYEGCELKREDVTAFASASKPIPHLSEPWYC